MSFCAPTIPTTPAVANMITFELRRAREEHPGFVASREEALAVLMEEVGEVATAMLMGDDADCRDEIAQVAAVCIRMLEREWGE